MCNLLKFADLQDFSWWMWDNRTWMKYHRLLWSPLQSESKPVLPSVCSWSILSLAVCIFWRALSLLLPPPASACKALLSTKGIRRLWPTAGCQYHEKGTLTLRLLLFWSYSWLSTHCEAHRAEVLICHAPSLVEVHMKVYKYMGHFISIRGGNTIGLECDPASWIISPSGSLNMVLGIEHQCLPWDIGA